MRFAEQEENSNDNPDGLDINIKFNDENRNFLFVSLFHNFWFNIQKDGGSKDKELQRREGLSNGLILYNNRRTVNTETPDNASLYFDLLMSE